MQEAFFIVADTFSEKKTGSWHFATNPFRKA